MGSTCAHGAHGHHHHHHHHGHHHVGANRAVRNIAIAFFLNAGFAIIELIGGWWTQSVAIQADAIHDLGDSLALASALGLQIWSGASANGRYNFGFKRLSPLSALLTSVILLIGSLFIFGRAVERLMNPVTPHLDGMFMLALLGVAVNGYAAWRMSGGKTHSERALSWHMIEDLLGWVAVLIGSVAMRFMDASWLDPALSLIIAGVVIMGASRNFLATTQLFLQAAPRADYNLVQSEITALRGVSEVGSLKTWSLDGEHHVASIRVGVTDYLNANERMQLKSEIRRILSEHGEFEVTIEMDEAIAAAVD